ncbi:hypothetical protein RJ639_038921 [Escallonia herrerae]|uniref:BHLH domain-containing protein n=1 Tax=Escallonia herrerae TaxID=1293975 RepID=A0AA88WMZ3_9ASTE|nr:hypothetical protein RJ639_038921 [Escallonia herrerae]
MPLSEFYKMIKGKTEVSQHKTTPCPTDLSYLPDNEFVELVWENGQIMMQGQSSKGKRGPISSNFQFHTSRLRDKDVGSATTSKIGKFGTVDSIYSDITMSVPSGDMGLSQDDDIVPWLNYPMEDTLQHDYCSDFLPELSGVTVNAPSTQENFGSLDKSNTCNVAVRDSHTVSVSSGINLEQDNAQKLSSSRTGQLYPWSLHQGQASTPSLGSGVSDIISSHTSSTHHAICGDSVQSQASARGFSPLKQKQNSNLLNFSHFSRPAAIARANLQNVVAVSASGSSGMERMGDMDKVSAASSNNHADCRLIDTRFQNEMGLPARPNMLSPKVDSKPVVVKPLEESRPAEQSDAVCREEADNNDKSSNQPFAENTIKEVLASEKTVEPAVASSACSGNSAERASNDLTNNMKRKCRDTEEYECQSEDIEEESVGVKKATSARGGTGSKRSRAAEVHNLSERRRRDRINEKMRALQELIPNCNKFKFSKLGLKLTTVCLFSPPKTPTPKVDKASMLDEAIEYLKTLQLQVQIMSMGAGLYMPPMMLPAGMQHMHPAHLPHFSPMGIGMGMGMGFGMGMVDMNAVSCGCPMIQVPPMQGAPFLAQPNTGPTGFQGLNGSNLHVFGHPGQGIPMSVSGSPLIPLPGRPPINSAMGLNASRMGVNVEVSSALPSRKPEDLMQNTSPQVMLNAHASSSINETCSQFQARNDGVDQSGLVPKNDRKPDAGQGAPATSTNDTVPSRAAGESMFIARFAFSGVKLPRGQNSVAFPGA